MPTPEMGGGLCNGIARVLDLECTRVSARRHRYRKSALYAFHFAGG
jgi:hypothetical protein